MIRLTIPDVVYRRREGDPLPAGFVPLTGIPLLILVGMTGSGKTTTVAALDRAGGGFGMLPERRESADAIVIPAVLAEEPGTPPPVDRIGRMALTRRFRERHPGGFAHVLANLGVALPGGIDVPWLLFDGLRGPEEVGHALATLPLAGLAVLDVPDPVRLGRLLGRRDAFDTLAAGSGPSAEDDRFWEGTEFTPGERDALLGAVPGGRFTPAEIRDRLMIIAEERRNYRMEEVAAIAASCPGDRMLRVDGSGLNPEEVASRICAWWRPPARS